MLNALSISCINDGKVGDTCIESVCGNLLQGLNVSCRAVYALII